MAKKFSNKEELIKYSNNLVGKKIKDIVGKDYKNDQKNKGKVGHVIEKYYFGMKLNNKSSADFEELGIELKTTPLKLIKKGLSQKERIVLTKLDLEDLIENSELKNSKKWKKIENMLIIWYLHNDDFFEREIMKVKYIDLSDERYYEELNIDWKIMHDLAKNGMAHKLSESLNQTISSARKGESNAKDKPQTQRLNPLETFKPRALTLKRNFVNNIYNEVNFNRKIMNFSDILNKKIKNVSFENIINDKKIIINEESKSKAVHLVNAQFDINNKSTYSGLKKYVSENYNENPTFHTIQLRENLLPSIKVKEHFKLNSQPWSFVDTPWENTKFSEMLENPFIFIIYSSRKFIAAIEYIFKQEEIDTIQNNFYEYIDAYNNGGMKKLNTKTNIGMTHFRPWGANKADTINTNSEKNVPKYAIWINSNYIAKILEKELKNILK